jgi:hypothetical protein
MVGHLRLRSKDGGGVIEQGCGRKMKPPGRTRRRCPPASGFPGIATPPPLPHHLQPFAICTCESLSCALRPAPYALHPEPCNLGSSSITNHLPKHHTQTSQTQSQTHLH